MASAPRHSAPGDTAGASAWLRTRFTHLEDGVRWWRNRAREVLRGSRLPFKHRPKVWHVIVFVVVLLVYPVVGTAALSLGLLERAVGSEDLRVILQKPAWTLWPGHIH